MLRFLLHSILWLTSKILVLLYTPFWLYYQCKRPKRCPPVYEAIYFLPAVTLAEKIRNRELSSLRVVTAYVERVKEVNPILNAVVEDRFESALGEARQIDEFLETSRLTVHEIMNAYPLLGVPITIKESFAVLGMSNDAGRKHSGKTRALDDANCVRRLKAAGVVVILVSNTPEICLNWETYNLVTGRTLNPYDTRRTCGGSSGGEAVLLATCASVIGLGSDVVGSLRLPPAFCGVYGHRPTSGLLPLDGHNPKCLNNGDEFWRVVFTPGPLARYAIDLPLLLSIMVKPELKHVVDLTNEVNVSSIKIYYLENSGDSWLTTSVSSQIISAIRKVIRHLTIEGFATREVKIKALSDIVDLCFIPLLDLNLNHVFSYSGKSVVQEIAKILTFRASVTPNAIFYVWVQAACKLLMSEKRLQKNKLLLEDLKCELLNILGDDGVLIFPAFTNVAHFHGQIYGKTLDASYLGIFSNMGLPITICPIGLSTDGLPISVQVISKPNNDRLCLALVREIERGYGGWTPPKYAI